MRAKVRLPGDQVGARVVTALLRALEGGTAAAGDVPVELVVPGSTAPPSE